MLIRRGLRASLRSLSAHGMRSALAVLGVAAGTAAVFLSAAIGAGARGEVLRSMEGLGTHLLVVRPSDARRLVARREVRGLLTTLDASDCGAIAALPLVEAAVPGLSGSMRVKAGDAATTATVLGTTAGFPDVRRFHVRQGRFLDEEDDRVARRVAVLGSRIVEALFPGEDPVGRPIRIRGVPYDVVGVFGSKGVLADGSDEDKLVAIPLRTAQRRVFNVDWLDSVFVSARDPGRMAETSGAIAAVLRERHRVRSGRPDDFAIQDKTRLLDNQRETSDFLARLSLGLAALAQLVGGTGILALMLLSVRERTPEIGLRMAVGATPAAILAQFLVEAAVLSLLGWLVGTVLGALGAWTVAAWPAWPVAVSPAAVAASLGLTLVTGLGFGAWPARRASLVPPIQALAGRGGAGPQRA